MDLLSGYGRPTKRTKAQVGQYYKDLDTGDIYRCVSANENSRVNLSLVGGYIWERAADSEHLEVCETFCGGEDLRNELDKLTEEIADLPNHIAQDVVDVLSKFDEEGDFVTITPKAGTAFNAVSTFEGQTFSDGYINGNLFICQAQSDNLFDAVGAFGGAGKTVTKNGVTCTINDDGTCTLNGAWEGSDGFVLEFTKSGVYAEWRFPAGVYTTDRHIAFRPKTMSNANMGNRWGGVQDVGSDFRFDWFAIYIKAGEVFDNEKVSLAFVRGTTLPESDHKFTGSATLVSMSNSKKIGDGSIDWNTGVIRDADGNEVETLASTVLPNLSGSGETVTMWVGNGTIHVTGEKASLSASVDNAEEAFDPTVWGLPVLKLHGNTGAMNKDTSVDLTYQYGKMSGVCSVKWQGSSSLSYLKKNYTVKFDTAFEAKEGWGAQKKYCLKANYIDHSHARNLINAKLWGQIVKSRSAVPSMFASLINGGAVDGFPVLLTINDKFTGLYTFNIPKDAWLMGMGSGTNECILCGGNSCPANGFKEEAQLTTDLEIEYITDEANTAWAKTSINNLIRACINSDGSDLDTTIAGMVDWQSAIDYYIYAVLIAGHDITQKNALYVTFDGVKWYMSAYDLDCTYGLSADGSTWLPANYRPSFESFASVHRLFELIKTYKADAVKSRYAELRETVLSESNIVTEFANFCGQIPKPVYMQEAKTWPMIPNTSANDISQIRDYYRMRVVYVDKWIETL